MSGEPEELAAEALRFEREMFFGRPVENLPPRFVEATIFQYGQHWFGSVVQVLSSDEAERLKNPDQIDSRGLHILPGGTRLVPIPPQYDFVGPGYVFLVLPLPVEFEGASDADL